MRRRSRWIIALTGACVLWAAAFVRWWPRDDAGARAPLAAVVTLSSDIERDSSIGQYGEGRLRSAIALAQRTRTPLLVTTRVKLEPDGPTSDWAQRRIIAAAGATDRWKIEPGVVRSTHDEAVHLVSLVPRGARVAVVTSRMHSRRACSTFERAGYRVTCVIGYVDPWAKLPHAIARESAASVFYWTRGWAFR